MANTMLAARGIDLGRSRIEQDKLALARTLLSRASERRVTLLLPEDVVVADDPDATAGRHFKTSLVPSDTMALDIGPRTVASFREVILSARSLFWNGPMGMFERTPFAEGTLGVARAIADCRGFTVVGGGDSVAAVRQAGLADAYGHVSTGGGASLEYIQGKPLPGLEALRA
jgi:phosphoglycerate kinase